MPNTPPDFNETNVFLLFWDCHGLEACVDITEDMREANFLESQNLFERIKNPDDEPPNAAVRKITNMINSMSLRARFNNQRNYELYFIHTEKSVSRDQFETMFNEEPQSAVDLIRDRGQKLFSYRNTTERVIS
jgi:hypothetical protein